MNTRFAATVLFVDMVDSTRRAVELGDSEWVDLQAHHDAMLRRTVRRYGGRRLQTLGDGLVAIFAAPDPGVRCGWAIAAASRLFDVEIRAGVHAGDCEQRGIRLGGIVFHIAARILARAGASEVLVSRVVKDLVGDGFVFRGRGRHRLKGLPGEWPLFAVDAVPTNELRVEAPEPPIAPVAVAAAQCGSA